MSVGTPAGEPFPQLHSRRAGKPPAPSRPPPSRSMWRAQRQRAQRQRAQRHSRTTQPEGGVQHIPAPSKRRKSSSLSSLHRPVGVSRRSRRTVRRQPSRWLPNFNREGARCALAYSSSASSVSSSPVSTVAVASHANGCGSGYVSLSGEPKLVNQSAKARLTTPNSSANAVSSMPS